MHLVAVILGLALVAGSCTARSPSHAYLDVNIDNVKKMVLEYDPVVGDEGKEIANAAESLAVRQFHEGIKEAEARVEADPIPAVAAKLGLTDLVQAVVAAGLKDTLAGPGPFTVFGPTNEAFGKLPKWAKEAIKNTTILADILKFHVLAGEVKSGDLKNDLMATTVEGKKLRINIFDNKAVTAQCKQIDTSKVDQAASNGVIHVLEGVMFPPAGTIVTTLVACPAFKTLVKAVQVAGLVETLNGNGPFTVFAPTDKAFAKLPPGTIEKLLKNPKMLAKILTYHVVAGTQCSAGLASGSVKTVEGQDVKVEVSSAGVSVGGAKVISADGSVTNGVVHAIDKVLLPPEFQLP